MNASILVLFVMLLAVGCASSPPQVIQLVPDKEPVCGFVSRWRHCCAVQDGLKLAVHCLELQEKEKPKPKRAPAPNPGRSA